MAPLARALGSVSPTTLTGIGLVVGVGSAGSAAAGNQNLALGLWLANRLIDGLDGAVARQQGTTSDRGGYFDLLADFIVYAAVPVGLVIGSPAPDGLAVPLGLLLGSFYVNAVSWLALSALMEKRSNYTMPERAGIHGRLHSSCHRVSLKVPKRSSSLPSAFCGRGCSPGGSVEWRSWSPSRLSSGRCGHRASCDRRALRFTRLEADVRPRRFQHQSGQA